MENSLEKVFLFQVNLGPTLQKELPQLVFRVFPEQLLPFIFFWAVSQKKFHKSPLQKSKKEQRFSKKKKSFDKNLFQSQGKKISGILKLNKVMSKLLTISKCLQLNC